MSTERIKVAIRIRPFLSNEDSSNQAIQIVPEDDNTIILYKQPEIFQGTFNQIFSSDSTQKDVFNFIKPCLINIQSGINCTILAYGQTGTGKTYTMFGNDWSFNENNLNINLNNNNEMGLYGNNSDELLKNQIVIDKNSEYNGIIPNLIMELYNLYKEKEKKENTNKIITCSYIQIYNEKIYDLLDIYSEKNIEENINIKNNSKKELKLKHDKIKGLIIEDANEILVPSFLDIFDILEAGENNRKIRQTTKNNMSSRSHTIFIISIEDNISHIKCKIKLCDLAGSERCKTSEKYEKEHMNELKNINKSLFTLGNVINALASKKKYIPYKDSKLTRILEDSLRGNSSIYLIANISPNEKNINETFQTLKFADRAHNIMVKISPNILKMKGLNDVNYENYVFKKNREIEQLKDELSGLKNLINIKDNRINSDNLHKQFLNLKKENNELKIALKKMNDINGFNKIINENKQLKRELNDLKENYANLRNDLLIKVKNNNYNFPLINENKIKKIIKNSLSQGNLFVNRKIYGRINKKLLTNKIKNTKKIEEQKNKKELLTDDSNKLIGDDLFEKFNLPDISKKKMKINHNSNRVNIINYKIVNPQKYKIREDLKYNKNILSSLKKIEMLESLTEYQDSKGMNNLIDFIK